MEYPEFQTRPCHRIEGLKLGVSNWLPLSFESNRTVYDHLRVQRFAQEFATRG